MVVVVEEKGAKIETGTDKKETSSKIFKVIRLINWALLRQPFFLLVTVGNSMMLTISLLYISQLRSICHEKGLTLFQTADILSIMAFFDIISRLLHGFLSDASYIKNKFKHPKKQIYTIMGFGISASLLLVTLTEGFSLLATSICLSSFFTSGMMVNASLVYNECFPEDLPSALGISGLFKGTLSILVGLFCGVLRTYLGGLNSNLYFLSAVGIFWMLLWVGNDLYIFMGKM